MNFKTFKKKLVLVLALVLIVSSFGATFAAGTFNDLNKAQWAAPTIEKWASFGLVAGYSNGEFKPQNDITRAEFAVIAYKAFNLESKTGSSFSDVKTNAWYYTEVTKMAKLGLIKGYLDGTFKPSAPITRAEAAAIIANVQSLVANEEGAKAFVDFDKIPTWARGLVGASALAKYISGYEDATFRATHSITRAEAVSMLNNAVYSTNDFANNWRIVTAGTYGGTADKPVTIKGNVFIKTKNVELKNVIIEGNLVFGVEIGEGNGTIDNVVVKGETRVFGGGINSIFIKNSLITKLIVIKENNTVRIVAQGSTTVDTVLASSGVKLQEIDLTTGQGFTEVNIDAFAGMTVEFIGLFDEIKIDSPNVKVVIPAGSVVTSLVINQPIDVTGAGTVTTAVVSVQGISFEKAPAFIDVDSKTNITVEIAGKDVTFDADKTTSVLPGPTAPPASGGTTPPVNPPAVTKMYSFHAVKGIVDVNVGEKSFDTTTPLSLSLISSVYAENKASINYPGFITSYSNFFNTALSLIPTGKSHTFAQALASRVYGYNGGTALAVFTQNANMLDVKNGVGNAADLSAIATTMANATVEQLVSDLSLLYAGDTETMSSLGLNVTILGVPYAGTVAGLQTALNTAYSGKTISESLSTNGIFTMNNGSTTIKFVIKQDN